MVEWFHSSVFLDVVVFVCLLSSLSSSLRCLPSHKKRKGVGLICSCRCLHCLIGLFCVRPPLSVTAPLPFDVFSPFFLVDVRRSAFASLSLSLPFSPPLFSTLSHFLLHKANAVFFWLLLLLGSKARIYIYGMCVLPAICCKQSAKQGVSTSLTFGKRGKSALWRIINGCLRACVYKKQTKKQNKSDTKRIVEHRQSDV